MDLDFLVECNVSASYINHSFYFSQSHADVSGVFTSPLVKSRYMFRQIILPSPGGVSEDLLKCNESF